jgi:ABC-type uncharacterized transport system involved in gliding motility auxiliary subunit
MSINRSQIATLGLYLVAVGVLGAFVFYVVQGEWSLPVQASLGLAVIGVVLFITMDPGRARRALTGRQGRYGSNALVMTLAFVGILVVINFLVFQNPERWDLTENKQHTLAPETQETLDALPEPVTARAFFTQRTPSDQAQIEQARDLLEDYQFASDGRFNYEFIDPDENLLAAQEANITRDDTIVLTMGESQEQVTFLTEREITAGLVRLMNPGDRVVYFLTGHGERDPEGVGDGSYSQVRTILETKNYSVQKLDLLANTAVPENASVVIIAGPIQPLSEDEVDRLAGYLSSGGAVIVMEEPIPVTDFGDSPDPLAAYLDQTWGIALGEDLIVDLSSNQPFVAVSSPNLYGDHLITQKLQGLFTLFPSSRSVVAGESPEGISPVELVNTAEQSWAERDLNSLESDEGATPDQDIDLLGPVPLAVLAENFQTDARLLVIGDSDFASNAFFSAYGNRDLIVNAVDWAAEQENLVNLTPRESTPRVLLPPTQYTMGLILLGSLILLPGSVILAGIWVWVRRRRRG